MTQQALAGVEVHGEVTPEFERVLTPEALGFVAQLHREFNTTRQALLLRRADRQAELDEGALPGFLAETADLRAADWQVAETPAPLLDRRVEITGPAERKMMINALNSGANVFMADLEDSLSPTWANVVQAQANLAEAVRSTLAYTSPEGKEYQLNQHVATLLLRPRGWHLAEKHLLINGEPVSASLFDFGLYFFHNAQELLDRGQGPYFYLAKLESHREARLWNDVFTFAQHQLGIPHGSVRATVLIETVPAAFEMDEILHELKDHASGLNAGRWDYIFSLIKKFHLRPEFVLPDRAQVTMTVPFLRAYTELLVKTCHHRGAHAIGGMAAFIPSRRDAQVNEVALAKVREDKDREAGAGFDGTWVAHPDLVPIAKASFDRVLADRPHQRERRRPEVQVGPEQLLQIQVPGGRVTEAGVRLNVSVALQYLDSWLRGVGAAAINNLMEDAATAEISRSQLWQWIRHGAQLDDGRQVTEALYTHVRAEELERLGGPGTGRLAHAAELLDDLVHGADQPNGRFADFLTIPAYRRLEPSAISTQQEVQHP